MNENTRIKLNGARKHLRRIADRRFIDGYLPGVDEALAMIVETLEDKLEGEDDFMGDSPGQAKMTFPDYTSSPHP